MADEENLPILHSDEQHDDPLVADSEREAVYVSRYHDHHAVAIGDEAKEEWIVAETAWDVDLFR